MMMPPPPALPEGGADGLSWATAFRYLQDALDAASRSGSGVTEIRVAQGTYKPDQGAAVTPGDRNATFLVPSGLALRGGFAGLAAGRGEDPDARDIEKFETILSGDLLGDDPPLGTWTQSLFTDNSRHVATILNGQGNLVEGLTIASGYRNFGDRGAGLYGVGGVITLDFCTFRGNWGDLGGGVGFSGNANLTVRDCTFIYNRAWGGGGLVTGEGLTIGVATIEDCYFEGNRATDTGGGGAIALAGNGSVHDCHFRGNHATEAASGGAIAGLYHLVESCTFDQNTADEGGALTGPMTCVDCQFYGNVAYFGGAARLAGKFINCEFFENGAYHRGGVHFAGHGANGPGGTFLNCIMVGNYAWEDAGGVADGGGQFLNCTLLRNDSWIGGAGALRVRRPTELVNCVLDGNTTLGQGAAIRVVPGSNATVVNCTVANNTSTQGVGGIVVEGTATIINSILWGNNVAQLTGSPNVTYSCIQDGWPGVGNISGDPLFVDALGSDGLPGTDDDDLHLQPNSPCIDAGDNVALPPDLFDLDGDGDVTEILPIDLAGMPRIATPLGNFPDPLVDMGAFEFQPQGLVGDINRDGAVDHADLLLVLEAWGDCQAPPADCPADIHPSIGDGVINFDDLLVVIFNWT